MRFSVENSKQSGIAEREGTVNSASLLYSTVPHCPLEERRESELHGSFQARRVVMGAKKNISAILSSSLKASCQNNKKQNEKSGELWEYVLQLWGTDSRYNKPITHILHSYIITKYMVSPNYRLLINTIK